MNIEIFSELLERIKTEPSVLFLGQRYPASLDGRDFFVEAVNSILDRGQLRPPVSYQQIWDCVGNGKLSEKDFTRLAGLVTNIPTQRWLRRLLSLRWGLVYTSAIDGGLVNCVGPDFSMNSIGREVRRFRRDYVSKRHLHGVFLYGSLDGNNGEFPPELCDERGMRRLQKGVNDRLQWIFDDILSDYGVLVIEGWDPETDWASTLLHNASAMPYQSIYLFGVSPQQAEADHYISGLIEDGLLCVEPRTFTQLLAEYGFLEDEDDDSFAREGADRRDSELGKTITINGPNKQPIYLDLPQNALDILDGSVTVIHDDLGNDVSIDINKSEGLARFFQPGLKPAWPLFNSKLGFYVGRLVDQQLLDAIGDEARSHSSYRRKIIVLEGDSNSGKTTALAHLALALRDKRQYPIIFISGHPSQLEFVENLKRFIKKWLQKSPSIDGTGADNVILIWDDNNDSNLPTVRQYKKMARELMECNVVLVGSAYRGGQSKDEMYVDNKTGIHYIPIKAELQGVEITALERVVKSADPELYERAVAQRNSKKESRTHLLNLIQQLAKFSYSSEWKEVAEILRAQFYKEVDVAEIDAQQSLNSYNMSEPDTVKEYIDQKGFAAAWQIKLAEYLQKYGNELKPGDEDENYREKLGLENDIILLNQVLAVASQFYVALPLSLLFRLIRKHDGIFGKREQFIKEVLQNDSLVRYYTDDKGYAMVRFRNPGEAALYVEKNFSSTPQERHLKEIELLCAIIKACRWDQEDHAVISLIRKFGPNSEGRIGQSATWGQYNEYAQWWDTVAETVKKVSEDNVEAVLVYAHFLREKYRYDVTTNGMGNTDYLRASAQVLRGALESHDRFNKYQYNRLMVEFCANLVASMPQNQAAGSFDRNLFKELRGNYREALATWAEADERNSSFTTNSLLDIWLNAVTNFRNSFNSLALALADQDFVSCLSDSVFYIDRLFDLNTTFDSINLLSKIDDIYRWSGDHDIVSLGEKLSRHGNDTYLYLKAWRCWLTDRPKPRSGDSLLEVVRYNLSFLPHDADRNSELNADLDQLKNEAIICARKSIEVLEREKTLIDRAKSSRCLEMLIKAKWLVYTGKLMLEEKQTFVISQKQWQEIYSLCDDYARYCSLEKVPASIPIQLVKAVYLWSFTDRPGDAHQEFRVLRQRLGSDWFIERIGLCNEETGKLCQFLVDITKNSSGNLTARIYKSLNGNGQLFDNLVNRYGIHVSERVREYLFDGQRATERYKLQKPVVLWFNAQGPTLGIPLGERGGIN